MEILTKYIWPLAIMLLLFSCSEREEPQPENGMPEFYLIGELNGEAFEYYAGEDAFNEAFSYQSPDGISWYSSRFYLTQGNNTIDPRTFDFELAISANDSSDAAFITEAGNIELQSDSIVEYYEVSFNSKIDNPAYNYSWDFGDGNTSTEINPVHRYPKTQSEYQVCLNIVNDGACIAEICQMVKPYLKGNLVINTIQSGSGLIIFEPQITGFEAINYEWVLENGNVINTRQVAVQSNSDEVIELCLKAKSRSSSVYEKCIQFNTGLNPSACVSNFNFISNEIIDTISNAIENRVVSTSLIINNSSLNLADFEDNYFEILASEPYLATAEGEATRKIEFRLELRLIDENGRFNHLKITDGAMALGIGNN